MLGNNAYLFVTFPTACRQVFLLVLSLLYDNQRITFLFFLRPFLLTVSYPSKGHRKRLRSSPLGHVLGHGHARARHVPGCWASLSRPHRWRRSQPRCFNQVVPTGTSSAFTSRSSTPFLFKLNSLYVTRNRDSSFINAVRLIFF